MDYSRDFEAVTSCPDSEDERHQNQVVSSLSDVRTADREDACESLPKGNCTEYLLARLSDPVRFSMPLRPSLEAVRKQLVELLLQPVRNYQNVSALVVGEKGCGKTLVIEKALQQIEQELKSSDGLPLFGVVRVNGVICSDDRTVFQEIARQLCGLFSLEYVQWSSLDENIEFLRSVLFELKRAQKAVYFVLDEFEHFTSAPRQKALYVLLDALQTADVQAALIGVSSQGDVLELLEKRLASRFSNRVYVVVQPAARKGELPRDMLKSMLTLPVEHKSSDVFNQSVEAALTSPCLKDFFAELEFEGFTPDEMTVLASTIMFEMNVQGSQTLNPDHVLSAATQKRRMSDSFVILISNLSLPELYVLVAASRLAEKSAQPFNFEALYTSYQELVRHQRSGHIFSRGILEQGFQDLVAMQILSFKNTAAR